MLYKVTLFNGDIKYIEAEDEEELDDIIVDYEDHLFSEYTEIEEIYKVRVNGELLERIFQYENDAELYAIELFSDIFYKNLKIEKEED